MSWEPVIGIEVHVELMTASKRVTNPADLRIDVISERAFVVETEMP